MYIFFFISRFMLFSILKKKGNIEKCPFTYWLNMRWFLHDHELGIVVIYIQYILYSLVLIYYLKCGGGLVLSLVSGCNYFSGFYAVSNISRKQILGI